MDPIARIFALIFIFFNLHARSSKQSYHVLRFLPNVGWLGFAEAEVQMAWRPNGPMTLVTYFFNLNL